MVASIPTTLLITFRREDKVQGNIGRGIMDLLDEEMMVAQYDELEFIMSSDELNVRWGEHSVPDFKKVIMYGAIGRNLRIAHPLANILLAKGVDVFTSGAEDYLGLDKLSQNVFFCLNDVPIPKTYYASPQNLIESAGNVLGFPMIVKDILSSQGERNYLVQDQDQLHEMHSELQQDRYIAQEFIENDGDIRLLISSAGEQLAFIRRAKEGSHLNNTSAGAEAILLDAIPEEVVTLGSTILEAINSPILGIDILSADKGYFVLEANRQPQIFTGAFIDEKKQIFKRVIE